MLAVPFEVRRHVEEAIMLVALFARDTDFGAIFKSVLGINGTAAVQRREHLICYVSRGKWVHRAPTSNFMSDMGAVGRNIAKDNEKGGCHCRPREDACEAYHLERLV